MMSARHSAVVLFLVLSLTPAASAVNYFLELKVSQHNATDGQQSFSFDMFLSDWFPFTKDDIQLALVAPNGRRFRQTSPFSNVVRADLEDILPGELDPTFSGTWTIEETLNGTFNQYEFDVPTMNTAGNFPSPAPLITAPENNDTVASQFDVEWDNCISSCGFQFTSTFVGDQVRPDITFGPPGTAQFNFEGPGFQGVAISDFSVTRSVFDPGGLLPVTPLNPTANSTFDQFGDLVFETLSPSIDFFVVPEPSGVVLLAPLFLYRRRP